jgi:hypothetical protein
LTLTVERIGGGKLRCRTRDDAVVIMPGEALVVNLARPAHALRAPAPGTAAAAAPDPGEDDFQARPDEGRAGKAVDLCHARGTMRFRPPPTEAGQIPRQPEGHRNAQVDQA